MCLLLWDFLLSIQINIIFQRATCCLDFSVRTFCKAVRCLKGLSHDEVDLLLTDNSFLLAADALE